MYTALYREMLAAGKTAVCRFIPRINASPSFVSLVAQQEVVEEGVVIVPAGLHLIYLPFADDMRKLTYEKNLPRANDVCFCVVYVLSH